jgi:hypothetical protein
MRIVALAENIGIFVLQFFFQTITFGLEANTIAQLPRAFTQHKFTTYILCA